MKQKTIFIGSAVLLLLVFIAGAILFNQHRAEQAGQLVSQKKETLVRFHSPTLGKADAPVHIVEFLDPACGTCREFYPLVKDLMAVNPGKIKLTVRYAPFHPGSPEVVRLLEAARRQDRFWPTLEALFASQPRWVQNHTAHVELVWDQLGGAGLDMGQLKKDMDSPDIARIIEQDLADAKSLNVTMTPEYFVNGKPLPEFGYSQLKTLVDDALANAKGS